MWGLCLTHQLCKLRPMWPIHDLSIIYLGSIPKKCDLLLIALDRIYVWYNQISSIYDLAMIYNNYIIHRQSNYKWFVYEIDINVMYRTYLGTINYISSIYYIWSIYFTLWMHYLHKILWACMDLICIPICIIIHETQFDIYVKKNRKKHTCTESSLPL